MGKKVKILLIDNDVNFTKSTEELLKINNYDVITAKTTNEGMNKVDYEQPDVIITELMLEKHDSGFTFTKKLKANPLYRKIPIFILTAVKEKTGYGFSQQLDGYWMKTDDYAEKPLEPNELLKRIEKLLDTTKSEQ